MIGGQLPHEHTLRQRLHGIVQFGQGTTGRIFQLCLVLLIMLSVAITPLEHLATSAAVRTILVGVETGFIIIFSIEYLLRLFAAPSRLAFIFSLFGIFDLICLLSFFHIIPGLEALQYTRLLRIFRLAEVAPPGRVWHREDLSKVFTLLDGEDVEFTVLRHPLTLIFGAVPTILSLGAGLGIFILFPANAPALAIGTGLLLFAAVFFWRAWLDFSSNVIYITTYRVVFQSKYLFGRSINQINYQSITNVKPFYPSILSYVFRYGTLVIDTAAEHPGEIRMDMVRRHEEAAHCIMEKTAQVNINRG